MMIYPWLNLSQYLSHGVWVGNIDKIDGRLADRIDNFVEGWNFVYNMQGEGVKNADVKG